jgi:hypothetical protein
MNRLEIIKERFPDHYEAALKVEDPTGTKRKYLLWITKQLAAGNNSPDIAQTLKFFHDNPGKFNVKDINKYKELKDLEDLVKQFGISNRQAKEQDKEGAAKIHEDDNLMVVRIDDKPAMVLYGAETRWCTTMKDQHYYEDYVSQGNDFYIVIRKDPKALASSKYAIVRKGLLDFSVYDAADNFARSFSENEEETLRDAIKAIITDKPPKNYLRMVVQGKIEGPEAAEWLRSQTKTTRDYIEGKRPDLKFVYKTTDELIDIFSNQYNRKYLEKIEQDKLIEMATRLKDMKDKDKISVKLDILRFIKSPSRLILAKDSDARVRAKVVEGIEADEAKKFFSDTSMAVFKVAARKVDINFLLEFASKSKSTRKRKAVNEVIVERISPEKVRAFVLNQPAEVLKDLMS